MTRQENTPRQPHAWLLPSLQELLKDEAPGRHIESPGEYLISAARMREVVRDALIHLFNTTSVEDMLHPQRHAEVANSVLNYGIPPLSGSYLHDIRWEAVERMVRRAIVRFEPRIMAHTLRVEPVESKNPQAAHTLHFTIHAMIHMDPHPVEFSLQGNMDMENSSFEATLVKN